MAQLIDLSLGTTGDNNSLGTTVVMRWSRVKGQDIAELSQHTCTQCVMILCVCVCVCVNLCLLTTHNGRSKHLDCIVMTTFSV